LSLTTGSLKLIIIILVCNTDRITHSALQALCLGPTIFLGPKKEWKGDKVKIKRGKKYREI
jgi:hypothetical protein